MNEFIEKAMLFINENTMLLIGICIFLILVLIGYLIDNAIKTRKLEKQELAKAAEEAAKEEPAPVAPIVSEAVVEATPVVDNTIETEEKIIEKAPEDLKATLVTEEIKEEPVVETPVAPVMPEVVPMPEPVIEEPAPVVETESMEALLNKDFSKNNEIVNNLDINEPVAPVMPEANNETPIVSEPVVTEVKEEPKSIYKSNSKLSDILGKKKTEEKPKLETTQDFSDELDRILNKLNEETNKTDETLETEEEINNRF